MSEIICKICGKQEIKVEYVGYIRDGALGRKTANKVKIFKCLNCGVIWHENEKCISDYYESESYRKELENTSEIEDFYRLHDAECMDKFIYTKTDRFRNKIVADIGCGGGSFLDFLSGVTKEVVAIEPSEKYRKQMRLKGYKTYPYLENAVEEYKGKCDFVMSYDVIEHVEDPVAFVKYIYELLNEGGQAIIGTPTDAPVMRELLGEVYEENLLFSTQHLWIFDECSLNYISDLVGIKNKQMVYKQRYGLGNFISWINEKKPKGHIQYNFVTETMDAVWKSQLEAQKKSDYILFCFSKD